MTAGNAGAPIVIAGCSRRKTPSIAPVSALELYQGGCIPALRAHVASQPGMRARVWIISAEHGLLHADTPLLPYDRRMDIARAHDLRSQVNRRLRSEFLLSGIPSRALVIAEPLYQQALSGLPAILGHDLVTWISDPSSGWPRAEAVLTSWRRERS